MNEREAGGGREAPGETEVRDETLEGEEPPPFGGSWARLYALVLGNLVFLVVLFYVFTKAFR